MLWGFLGGSVVKNLPANAGDSVRFLGREMPWRRKRQPTPVFLPGKSHEQRSLADYSSWDCRESNTTQQLNSNNNAALQKEEKAIGIKVKLTILKNQDHHQHPNTSNPQDI